MIIHVPAFAEEMNKSRHMVSQQARAFAEQGYATLVFDYYGTGDSEGEFADSNWDIWQQDLLSVIDWCSQHVSDTVLLWGLRFGALLATSVIAKTKQPIKQLVLWQPVASGEQYMTQFLRLKLAGGMMTGASKETVQDLKAKLDKGETLEVGGYCISQSLYQAVSQQSLMAYDVSTLTGISWYEVNTKPRSLSPVGQKVVDHWNNQSVPVASYQAVGSQFWSNQEIVFADELVELTCQHLLVGKAAEDGGELERA